MSKPVDNKLAVEGKCRQIKYAALEDGTTPALDYIEKLCKSYPNAKTDILAKFGHVAENGEIGVSPKVFKRERNEISTFKYKPQKNVLIRFPCFRMNNCWIITHGFQKVTSKSKWPESEFDEAHRIRNIVLKREKQKKNTSN